MSEKNIYQRMALVMEKVQYIQKSGTNSFQNYKYVSHDAVVGMLRSHITDAGILTLTDVIEMTREIITDTKKTNVMATVKLQISFVNVDKPEDRIVIHAYGEGMDTSDKACGKAVSYALKFGLLKMFLIETGTEIDNENEKYNNLAVTKTAQVPVAAPEYTVEQINAQKRLMAAQVDPTDITSIGIFIAETSKLYKKGQDEIIMKYTDLKKFSEDFINWKIKAKVA